MKHIRIVIAEDHYFTNQGICHVLEAQPDFQVADQVYTGESALQAVRGRQPDVLLLDIHMPPGIDGVGVIKQLRAEDNQIPIIALTDDARSIRRVQKAGGNGYLAKENFSMLAPAIHCVVHTGSPIFINPEISQTIAAIHERVEMARLLESEREVWRLIGFRNDEIARRLNKTVGTIRNVITSLYFKLDIPKSTQVTQRVQATELARSYGILVQPPVGSSLE